MEHKGVNRLSPRNKAFIGSKNYTKQNLKKAFKSKLLEICKTRTKMSNPHMFNFFDVLAGHDIVTDVGRATTRSRKFKAPLLQTKGTKIEGPLGNMGLIRKTD